MSPIFLSYPVSKCYKVKFKELFLASVFGKVEEQRAERKKNLSECFKGGANEKKIDKVSSFSGFPAFSVIGI